MMKETDDYMTFGDRLAYTRKHKGFMQKQLAELVGVSASTVGNWENNQRKPTASRIRKITTALEVSEDWFERDDNFSVDDLADNQRYSKLTKQQQQLVLNNEYIIYCVLKKYNLTPFQDDMWDVGEIGLCKAAQRWDEKDGVSFFTVAFNYIKWEFNTTGRSEIKNVFPKISLDQPIEDNNSDTVGDTLGSFVPDPDDEWEHLEYRILVESVCQKVEHVLSPKEKVAFTYWLQGKKNGEIAKAMGVCFQTTSECIQNAKNKCRSFFNAEEMFA